MQTVSQLTLEDARRVADAARAKAVAEGWNVVIAIVDAGAHLMLLERADGTQLGSVEVAQAKARSAILFKRPTKAFEDAVQGGRTVVLNLSGAMPIEGGLPLVAADGHYLGAIGVSGVLSAQDGQIAAAGVAAL
ncbi:GlcG/HbpS family heme-binding protein [Inhella proteolytica]|uniref:Heme-binding protein n=1 Tax=Inhella proteolytica TaxID=2795029 RepID=A0A931J5M7_9BURK|nr:heme-binding protein [Inhella proteolytica]MBH9579203.1 heme-binding protein [Inhella proteolytica]